MADFLSLQDQIPQIHSTVDAYIEQLHDVRTFYKERVAIERQASEALAALAKRAQDTYAQRAASLVVGESPATGWNGQHNSLGNAWATTISEASAEANDRAALADALQHEVIDTLKVVIQKKQDLSKKHYAFYNQLVGERDKTASARDAAKSRYDSACRDVESHRAKQEHATDKHAEKAGRHFDKASVEMSLAKNDYLRSIAVANAAKEHYFQEDMPALTKTWQSIWMLIVRRCTIALLRANDLMTYQRNAALLLSQREKGVIEQVDVAADQATYAKFNQRTFFKPGDSSFEPCPVWHDNASVDLGPDQCRVLLQNSAAVAKRKLSEPTTIETMRKEVQTLDALVTTYVSNASMGDPDEVQEGQLDTHRSLMLAELDRSNMQADVAFILQALGDDLGGGQPHQLKPTAFPVPVACAVCASNIWGIGKPGSTCRQCGLSVHKACELKLPASCGQPAPAANNNLKRSESRASTSSSVSSSRIPPSKPPPRGSIRRPPPFKPSRPTSVALYPYTAADGAELSIAPGDQLTVLSADEGGGWSKVEDASGRKGLVPASYIGAGGAAAPASNGAAETLTVIHDFEGTGGDEAIVSAGEQVALAGKGRAYGDGWVQIRTAHGVQIVPEWAVQ